MTKGLYRLFVRSQKEQARRKTKLVHLLINYRSFNHHARYPHGMHDTMMECTRGQKLLDYGGLWHFKVLTCGDYQEPSFYTERVGNRQHVTRDRDNADIPF